VITIPIAPAGGPLSFAFVAVKMEYNWDFYISLTSIITSIGVSIFVGITFGMYPARKAAKLNPIDALRYE